MCHLSPTLVSHLMEIFSDRPRQDAELGFRCKCDISPRRRVRGLARRTARWMACRGATNLILLSRSGPHSDAAASLVEDLRACNVHVEAPACDITSEEALSRVLEDYSKTKPPIKGCIQGAMVLKVRILEIF